MKPLSTSVIGDENMMDLQTMANGRGLSGERGREELVCLDGWRLPRRHKRTSDGKREGRREFEPTLLNLSVLSPLLGEMRLFLKLGTLSS